MVSCIRHLDLSFGSNANFSELLKLGHCFFAIYVVRQLFYDVHNELPNFMKWLQICNFIFLTVQCFSVWFVLDKMAGSFCVPCNIFSSISCNSGLQRLPVSQSLASSSSFRSLMPRFLMAPCSQPSYLMWHYLPRGVLHSLANWTRLMLPEMYMWDPCLLDCALHGQEYPPLVDVLFP